MTVTPTPVPGVQIVDGPTAPTLARSSVRLTTLPTASDVLAHLGWPVPEPVSGSVFDSAAPWGEPEELALAAEHLQRVTDLAHAHTRGRGFTQDGTFCASAIAAVCVRAAARSMTNPTSDRQTQAGTLVAQPGSFVGWSLVELQILNDWRVRVG